MGIWPEFYKCCGVVPLKTGTIAIGCFTAISNGAGTAMYLVFLIFISLHNEELSTAEEFSAFTYFILITFLLVSLFGTTLGVIILVGWNKPHYLKKAVFGMTTLSLLNLLTAILSMSNVEPYEVYIRAFNMLLSAYFILIIRSAQLQLEGRLNSPQPNRFRRQRPTELQVELPRSQMFPPPPNYEEAIRSRPVYRCEFNLTLPPTDEVANENIATTNEAAMQPDQTNNNSVNTIEDVKDEPKIYDVEQFNAVRNLQVVERNQASTSIELN